MKNKFTYLLSAMLMFTLAGCQSYLDKQPDMGNEENDIYKDYTSITLYLDRCIFELEDCFQNDYRQNSRSHNSQMSDECATTDNNANTNQMNVGNWLEQRRTKKYEIGVEENTSIARAYRALRIANRVIGNHEKIRNITDEEREMVLGQAHFFRAWYYFELLKRYGGMPILDKVMGSEFGATDIPRKTYQESHEWMTGDLDEAIRLLPDYWDDLEVGRPTKASAMALRSMTELYAASPLMQNDLGSTSVKPYNPAMAENAAKLADAAIKYVDQSEHYRLVTDAEYKNIFYFANPPYTHPEHLWYNRRNKGAVADQIRIYCLATLSAGVTGSFGASIVCPTLNAVNWYEKKGADGIYYPTTDPRAGYSLGNKPFDDRDPRFYNNILRPGDRFGKKGNGTDYVQSFFVGGTEYDRIATGTYSNGRQISGFMHKKFVWPEANQWGKAWQTNRFGTTVYIRVAQLYLDFAEASFEATGSATAVIPGCAMSAERALNIVRNRVGVTDLPADIVSDPDKFREAYRRERAVELFMENHRWWDIRRWMIAHDLFAGGAPIKGIKAYLENAKGPVENGAQDAKLRIEEYDMTIEIRNFEMKHYWYPFPAIDVSSLENLKQNPGW